MITPFETFPPSLKDLNPPLSALFYQGDLSLLEAFKVSIVGSRRPNIYAKNATFALASALKAQGAVVISGAAIGIDAMAHKGAFPKTIAVMANSLNLRNPPINKSLIETIEQDALVLSEYPLTTHPTRYSFVQRNRIVVGLSDCVVLAQADLKSGTMRSAEYALDMGKPLYALVHHMGESLGTQMLLEKGYANPIYSIEGFINDIALTTPAQTLSEEDEILKFCRAQPNYDAAVAKFGAKLFEYELLGKIEVLNGKVITVKK